MNAEVWRQIQYLFERVSAAPHDQRDRILADAPVTPEIRARVDSMLKHTGNETEPDDGPASKLAGVIQNAISELAHAPLEKGTRVGRYRITRLIASGGMGDVYLAHSTDGDIEIPAAIKVSRMPSGRGADAAERAADRFDFERQVLLRLDHAAIPKIIDTGTTRDGHPYLVMDFVDGLAIDSYCHRHDLLVRERVALVRQVCDAIHHAHQRLVVHRDIKPSNILVRADGQPRVLDFGIASEMSSPTDHPRLTRTGEFVGTLAYASPEQLDGSSAPDTRSDVYALGVVLYELLTESLPHGKTTSLPMLLEQIRSIRPPTPSAINPRIDADLSAVVMRAIAREPERRYQSVADFASDLQNYIDERPVTARADSRWYMIRSEIRLRRVPILSASVLLTASLAFGIYATAQSRLLSDRNAALVEALSRESIERAGLLSQSGSLIGAERLLWPQLDEGSERARWALRNLYSRFPVRATISIPFNPGNNGRVLLDGSIMLRDRSNERAWIIDPDEATMVPFQTAKRVNASQAHAPKEERWALRDGQLSVLNLDLSEWTSVSIEGGASVLSMSPNHIGCLVLCDDRTLRTIDASGSELRSMGSAPLGRSRTMIASTPSGDHSIQVTDSEIRVFDSHTGEPTRLEDTNGWVESICIVPTEPGPDLLVACSADNLLRIWRLDTTELVLVCNAFDSTPTHLLSLPDQAAFVAFEERGVIRVWDLEDLIQHRSDGHGTETGLDLEIDPRARALAVGIDGAPHRFELLEQDSLRVIASLDWDSPICAITPDADADSWLIADYNGGVARLARTPNGLEPAWRASLPERPNSIALSPDGTQLAVACDRGIVSILHASDGHPSARIELNALRVPSIAWRPGHNEIMVCTFPESDLISIEDPSGSARVSTVFDGAPRIGARVVAYSPDGDRIAMSGDDALIRIWEKGENDSWDLSQTLSGHSEGLFTLDYSLSGERLVSAGRSGTVIVWDTRTAEPLARIDASDRMLFSARISDDERSLIATGIGSEIFEWDIDGLDKRLERNRPDRVTSVSEAD